MSITASQQTLNLEIGLASHSPLEVRQNSFAEKFRITGEEYRMLAKACTHTEVIICLELLKVKAHRSSFRKKMEDRIREWFKTPITSKPLTPAMFDSLLPRWPVKYSLPN